MDGVVAEFLRALRESELAFGGTRFGGDAEFEVLLRVGIDDLAEEFRELGGVFGFLEGDALVGLGHFGEPFAVGLAAHGEVHAHFGTFTREVLAQPLHHLGVETLGHTDLVLVGPHDLAAPLVFLLEELALGGVALGTFVRSLGTHVDITADFADPYFHFCLLSRLCGVVG